MGQETHTPKTSTGRKHYKKNSKCPRAPSRKLKIGNAAQKRGAKGANETKKGNVQMYAASVQQISRTFMDKEKSGRKGH